MGIEHTTYPPSTKPPPHLPPKKKELIRGRGAN